MKALALLGVLALVGCGSAQVPPPAPTVADSLRRSQHILHSADHHYTVRQVQRAFAEHGIRLRKTEHFPSLQPWDFLDGRPAHPVYVYVENYPCKCAFAPKFPWAHKRSHGNVTAAFKPAEKQTVLAALRELR